MFADQWQQFVHDSVALMAQFIAVCSPKAILEMPPLDSGAPITNIWLGAVAHRRWLLTAKPYVILADLDVALSACEVAWHALAVEMLEGDSAAADDPVIEIAAESFLQSLGGLAKVLAEIGRVPRYG